jgi:hypothetical protein
MDLKEAIERLEAKFRSGNKIPVGRTTITRNEWEAIKKGLCSCKTKEFKILK